MRRPPKVSQGQINRGLCGIRGCPDPAGKHTLDIEGRKVPVCRGHHQTDVANKKAAIKNKKKRTLYAGI